MGDRATLKLLWRRGRLTGLAPKLSNLSDEPVAEFHSSNTSPPSSRRNLDHFLYIATFSGFHLFQMDAYPVIKHAIQYQKAHQVTLARVNRPATHHRHCSSLAQIKSRTGCKPSPTPQVPLHRDPVIRMWFSRLLCS